MDEFTLMESIAAHFGEFIVGIVLLVFGWAFQSWAKNLKASSEQWGQQLQRNSDRILSKLEGLAVEFHNHRVDIENRVTRVETKVDIEREERHAERAERAVKDVHQH